MSVICIHYLQYFGNMILLKGGSSVKRDIISIFSEWKNENEWRILRKHRNPDTFKFQELIIISTFMIHFVFIFAVTNNRHEVISETFSWISRSTHSHSDISHLIRGNSDDAAPKIHFRYFVELIVSQFFISDLTTSRLEDSYQMY